MKHVTLVERGINIALAAHRNGYQSLPLAEQLVAAIILNRADWLETIGLTIADAIEIVDIKLLTVLSSVQRIVGDFIEHGTVESLSEARSVEGAGFAIDRI